MNGTKKQTTDTDRISREEWAEGAARSPDDHPEQEGGPARAQPEPDKPSGGSKPRDPQR